MAEETAKYVGGCSYRVHFARVQINEHGGEAWFGKEDRLSASSPEDALVEFEQWKESHKDDKLIRNFCLLEVRELAVKSPAEAKQ